MSKGIYGMCNTTTQNFNKGTIYNMVDEVAKVDKDIDLKYFNKVELKEKSPGIFAIKQVEDGSWTFSDYMEILGGELEVIAAERDVASFIIEKWSDWLDKEIQKGFNETLTAKIDSIYILLGDDDNFEFKDLYIESFTSREEAEEYLVELVLSGESIFDNYHIIKQEVEV